MVTTSSERQIWTDSSGVSHLIHQLSGPTKSELSFLLDDDTREYYSIPTIQNIDYSQNVNIPTHPTLIGSFKTQFTKSNPATLSFDIILKEDLFINYDDLSRKGAVNTKGLTVAEMMALWEEDSVSMDEVVADTEYFTVKELVSVLEGLKNDRRVFTLTTSTDLDELLDNLVIESIAYNFNAEAREITTCSINATRVQFQDLEYTDVDEAFLNSILIKADPLSSETTLALLKNVYIDGADKFSKWDITDLLNRNIYNEMSVVLSGQFGNIPEYYWNGGIVDMKVDGSSTYTFDLSFSSQAGISTSILRRDQDIEYSCGFGRFRIITNYRTEDATYEPLIFDNVPWIFAKTNLYKNAGVYLYDVADIYSMLATYDWLLPSGYNISDEPKTFKLKALNAIFDAATHDGIDLDKTTIAKHNNYLYGFRINKSYSYQVEYLDPTTRQWTNASDVRSVVNVWGSPQLEFFTYNTRMTLDTTTVAALIDNKSKESIDNYWNSLLSSERSTSITIGVLTVGTQMEVFVFDPTVLTVKNVKSIVDEGSD
jgi:hypothetical protein